MDTTTLCKLTAHDAADIARLEADCFPSGWSEEQYKRVLSIEDTLPTNPLHMQAEGTAILPFSAFWLFGYRSLTGELLGYVCLSVLFVAQELEVHSIAVAKEHRQKGLARQLLAFALQEAKKYGILKAWLDVRPSNTAALALYQGLGFVAVGRRKKYYADTGEDALVLCRNLAI